MRKDKRYLTVVYQWISSARSIELISQPDVMAAENTHAMRERDCWRELVQMSEAPYNIEEVARSIERMQRT